MCLWAEVDAARRQRELFEAADYRCVAPTRPERTADDVDVGSRSPTRLGPAGVRSVTAVLSLSAGAIVGACRSPGSRSWHR